jgi:murein DD-endopeptidase MepM/ murein hydrolase activator NlpD
MSVQGELTIEGIILVVKRVIIFIIFLTLLLSSCRGNTSSLWGQYQTPTPVGGSGVVQAPVFEPVPTQTSTIEASPPTSTPTSLLSSFVTQPATLTPTQFLTPTQPGATILYYTQNGDWLPAVARRFHVDASEITSPKILPTSGFLDTGTLLIIPDRRDTRAQFTSAAQLIPDSEIIFSTSAVDFNVSGYVQSAGGYLSTYREYLGSTGWMTGAAALERSAYENSINPRLLLALLDYEAQWVRGLPADDFHKTYPLGYENFRNKGMFLQFGWAINQLSTGYYGWRMGTMTEITFNDGTTYQLDPSLNAGTVAIMYFFSKEHSLNEWLRIMDPNSGFASFYANMFGDPWSRAESAGSIFPPSLSQPGMILPFESNTEWAYTGGPHSAWGDEGPLAAVDFAPSTAKSGCAVSDSWVLAMAPGLVVRSGNGIVVVDLDGDGHEQTGWNILYLHIANKGRVALGTWVEQNDNIGHPSCEGGISTGTHTHVARKYNGEWVIADGPIPWVLSGWTVIAGDKPYLGKLVKGNQVVTADVYGQAKSLIVREDDD